MVRGWRGGGDGGGAVSRPEAPLPVIVGRHYPFLQFICSSLRSSSNAVLQCTLVGGKAGLF